MEEIFKRRSVRLTLLLLIALVSFAGIYLLRVIFAPLILGFLLAYVLDPFADWLEARRLSRLAAVGIIFGIFAVVVIGVGSFGSIHLARGIHTGYYKIRGEPALRALAAGEKLLPGVHFKDINGDKIRNPGYASQAADWIEERLPEGWMTTVKDYTAAKYNELQEAFDDPERRNAIIDRVWKWASRRLGSEPSAVTDEIAETEGPGFVFSMFSWFVLCPLYVFFFLLEIDPMIAAIRRHLPGRFRPVIERIFRKIDKTLSAFFRGRLTVCLIKGGLTAVGLLVMGVPFWLPIGLAAGFLGLIPYVGIFLAIVPALFLSWFEYQSMGRLGGTAAVFAAMEGLEGFVLIPLFLGKEIGLHPLTIIVTLLIFGKLFGFLGVLLSVPLAAITKILGQEFVMPLIREFAEEKPIEESPP
jgi:predicted PurR-regulated permease PerM